MHLQPPSLVSHYLISYLAPMAVPIFFLALFIWSIVLYIVFSFSLFCSIGIFKARTAGRFALATSLSKRQLALLASLFISVVLLLLWIAGFSFIIDRLNGWIWSIVPNRSHLSM